MKDLPKNIGKVLRIALAGAGCYTGSYLATRKTGCCKSPQPDDLTMTLIKGLTGGIIGGVLGAFSYDYIFSSSIIIKETKKKEDSDE